MILQYWFLITLSVVPLILLTLQLQYPCDPSFAVPRVRIPTIQNYLAYDSSFFWSHYQGSSFHQSLRPYESYFIHQLVFLCPDCSPFKIGQPGPQTVTNPLCCKFPLVSGDSLFPSKGSHPITFFFLHQDFYLTILFVLLGFKSLTLRFPFFFFLSSFIRTIFFSHLNNSHNHLNASNHEK